LKHRKNHTPPAANNRQHPTATPSTPRPPNFNPPPQAAATWTRVEVLQQCREACGGMGFLAANKIGPMITDTNVDVTFEGETLLGGRGVARCGCDGRHRSPIATTQPTTNK
jgi:hypothetical protein